MIVSFHKNIIKATLLVAYVLLIFCVVFGISSIYSYLNTGADRNLMLHHKLHKTVHYQPNITWDLTKNEGRIIDPNTLKNIEKDYLNSWYVKQIAFDKNTQKGLKDYYTKSALNKLVGVIENHQKTKTRIVATTLAHRPSLDFFSEDGQLAVITDYNVQEYKQVYLENKLLLERNETNTYQILLLLEDGFWRTRQILKTSPTNTTIQTNTKPIKSSLAIKGINYYPQKNPWKMYNDDFDEQVIQQDFQIIQQAGLNTIRIFVPYQDFGKSEVKKEKLDKLEKTLNIAQQNHLKVIVTLFDFYGNYHVLDWTLNNKHASAVVNRLKNHPALYAWDIKNEPNLDFKSRGKQRVLAWLHQMLHHIKTIDTKTPITIGWSNTQNATLLKEDVDFVSFHYYEDLNKLATAYQVLKQEIPHKQIVLGEYGMSSYKGVWNVLGNTEQDQADYHQAFQKIAASNNIPFISWTLYDFTKIPKEVVGRLPWRKNNQKRFGFINHKSERKKSFKFISKP